MRLRNQWIACLLYLLTCASFQTPAYAYGNFFDFVEDSGAHLPAHKIYPQGRIFPYGGFSGNASREASNDYTLLGPLYGSSNDRVIMEAEAHDMKAIYIVGIDMNFLERDGQPALTLSAEEIAEQIKQQVLPVVDSDVIAWWYIMPEELRSWRQAEMDYLEIAIETIRAHDPKKRPILMYDPNHRNAGSLVATGQFLDMSSKGMYTNYAGQKGHRIWSRWTIEQEIEAINRIGRPEMIPLALPEMFQQPDSDELSDIPLWVRHDVYLSLVTGAKGIIVFSLGRRSGFPAFEDYYKEYAQVARELNGDLNLGHVFLFGERRNDLQLKITSGESVVSPKVGSGGITELIEYPSVSIANIAYGFERYLFVVNSSEEPVNVTISGMPVRPVYVRDVFTGQPLESISSSFELALDGLEVRALRLSPGYVRLLSPQPDMPIDLPIIPVRIDTPGLSPNEVSVFINGDVVYEGDDIPQRLFVKASDLSPGVHTMEVTVVDELNRIHVETFQFEVNHIRLSSPEIEWGTRLRGTVPLDFQFLLSPDEIKEISVSLLPISLLENDETLRLYVGRSIPPTIQVDTSKFEDGAYDIHVELLGVNDERWTFSRRIVIDNWNLLEDPMLPPTTGGWFGPQERLKVAEKSEGWEYTGSASDLLFGDPHRVRRKDNHDEHLIWKLPSIAKYQFTLYTPNPDLVGRVFIALSNDGEIWRHVTFGVEEGERSSEGWLKLKVQGDLLKEEDMNFIRLTLTGGNDGDHVIEIGEASIRSLK